MLKVATTLSLSRIHGIGLIAAEFIPKGSSVQEFVAGFDLEFTFENLCRLPGPATEQMLHYAYCRKSDGIYVLRGDNARFLNHSTDPNLGLGPNKEENVALQDIRKWGRVDRQLLRL